MFMSCLISGDFSKYTLLVARMHSRAMALAAQTLACFHSRATGIWDRWGRDTVNQNRKEGVKICVSFMEVYAALVTLGVM